MNKETAVKYIESLSSGLRRRRADGTAVSGKPLDNPGRTRFLLSCLGNPQRNLRFIHVCGSNGKGSVSAMLERILREAGFRTGLYTSPHLQDFCERIRVNGEMISGDDLAAYTERLMPAVSRMEQEYHDKPGLFCFLTALGIEYFSAEKCDYVLLETGLGGTYDSTNAIESPEMVIVTNIGLEHTEILGDTIGEIARDKAGIIKPGCSVAAYNSSSEALTEIRRACEKNNVPLYVTDFSRVSKLTEGEQLSPQPLRWDDTDYSLALPGSYQIRNAALVLTAVQALRDRGCPIPESAVRRGLARVSWPARFEILSRNPLVILDGGHNPQCAQALAESLEELFPDQRMLFVIGMMKDKNYEETLRILLPFAEKFYCTEPPDDRALPAGEMRSRIERLGGNASAFDSVGSALSAAMSDAGETPVIAFGSLYLAGEIRDIMKLDP